MAIVPSKPKLNDSRDLDPSRIAVKWQSISNELKTKWFSQYFVRLNLNNGLKTVHWYDYEPSISAFVASSITPTLWWILLFACVRATFFLPTCSLFIFVCYLFVYTITNVRHYWMSAEFHSFHMRTCACVLRHMECTAMCWTGTTKCHQAKKIYYMY